MVSSGPVPTVLYDDWSSREKNIVFPTYVHSHSFTKRQGTCMHFYIYLPDATVKTA
jgi:hypothetical protein